MTPRVDTLEEADARAALFALSHKHRFTIFQLLVEAGESGLAAGVISGTLGMTPSSLTFHTQHLQRGGLINQRRFGRYLIYTADLEACRRLVNYLAENICALPSSTAEDSS